MTVTAIDTHAVVKRLVAAGFTDAQAEAVTEAVRETRDINPPNFDTSSERERTIVELKVQILKWTVVGAMALQTVIVTGVVAILIRTSH